MSGSHARLLGWAFVAVLAATMPLRAQDYFEQKKRELALQAQHTPEIYDEAVRVGAHVRLWTTSGHAYAGVVTRLVDDSIAVNAGGTGGVREEFFAFAGRAFVWAFAPAAASGSFVT